jgi:ElaB/YqjD/DUF883 family membrane-anchored ribosome-binding protein
MKTESNMNNTVADEHHDEEDGSFASREFQNFLADIEDLIKQTASVTGEDLTLAKAKLSERVAAAKQSVNHMATGINEKARQGAGVTNDYVHAKPWQTIGAAAVIGLLLGFALGRR